MLTRLTIRNFKGLEEVEVELGNPVVFIGPNDSGKTSALQALTLWDLGLRRWTEKRGDQAPPKRPGVAVNRRDLVGVPGLSARQLWRELSVRAVHRGESGQRTENIRIDVVVEGVTGSESWRCGLEFDYINEESFYCRPLRTDPGGEGRMPVIRESLRPRVALLGPISGLTTNETRLELGAIDVRLGEGRTAEVLRNLCFRVHEERPQRWQELVERIHDLFGASLEAPRYVAERGEIVMSYQESGVTLDLSSSGRGLQQTLLILAYMYANPGAVLLLDEPDAHLEILRQRQIYKLLTDTAAASGSQIVAASHSEVVLNEAAGKDVVIAFVGSPHRIDDRSSQLRKALVEIGFEHYLQAEQKGWVLYLEGATDLAILQAFAHRLGHEKAIRCLEQPFVRYVGNRPSQAERHFFGLREASPQLEGIALFDRLEANLPDNPALPCLTWERREIENYLCTRATLEAYAEAPGGETGSLFALAESEKRLEAMRSTIEEVGHAVETLGKGSLWSADAKASDDVLAPLFAAYFKKLGLDNLMAKGNVYTLAGHVPQGEIDPEIGEKLDKIAAVAARAREAPLP